MGRPIPIGVEFYKEIIEKNYYYIDKTLLIRDLLDNNAKVSLFTRPRRFGKTLALNMLKIYFEDERNRKGEHIDNRHYFEGKKILFCDEKYTSRMNRYPVINLSLKSAKQPTYEMAYNVLVKNIQNEFRRHDYILQGDGLDSKEKETFCSIYEGSAEADDYATALAFLSDCLKKYHKENTVILIDEYDVPLENAYFEGFYDKMVFFVRSLFESALKTNNSLELAVITGCLRISKESIFTGLNNMKVNSILRDDCAEYYGFTEAEVCKMLQDYDLEDCMKEAREWYDGYCFGDREVYNPWSILSYVDEKCSRKNALPRPYWSNTSSNSIVRELVEGADLTVRQEIEDLISGGQIEKPVHEDITYGDIHESQDNLWSFLFFTGYLKKIKENYREEIIYLQMTIPNAEIRSIYKKTILAWFDKKVKMTDLSALLQAIESGDCKAFGELVSEQLRDTISFYDYAENYYHGFLTGLLKGNGKYQVISNRESGNGRPDIVMMSLSVKGKAFIMELKVAKDFRRMEERCGQAIAQALRQDYRAELERIGYSDITIYGICFYRKECEVRKG